MRKPHGPRCAARQSGGVLVIVVLLLALIALPLTLSQGGYARTEMQIAHGDQLAAQALSIAEAGLNHTYALLKADGDGFDDELNGGGATGGTGGLLAGVGAGADQTLEDGRNYRFVAFGGVATDGYYVRVDDNFDDAGATDDPATDQDGKVWVTVRGRVAGAERVVKATVSHGAPVGVFGTASVVFSGNGSDSYTGGAYVPGAARHHGNLGSNGAVAVGAGAFVDGNVASGAAAMIAPGATVTGTVASPVAALAYPSSSACGPYSSGAGITGTYWYSSAFGQLAVAAGGNATLAPGTYCFSGIALTGGGTLTVTGPTVINLTGASDLSGGQIVNATSNAASLQINVGAATTLALPAAGTQGYAYVYAPAASVIVAGAGPFYGAIVGATVTIAAGATIHVDESIAAGGALAGWHELRN
jgi:hypothetical protein